LQTGRKNTTLKRLDKLLVDRGLVRSREEARQVIENGSIEIGGLARNRPASMVSPDIELKVTSSGDGTRWVSRGAHKLIKGLDAWGVEPRGFNCVDVGASTGGFTQVLLSRGAARVVAVDVGYGQLSWVLRNDPKVVLLERTNARYLTLADIGPAADLVTVDASFISLRLLLPTLKALLSAEGSIIALVKPQFEVGRKRAGKGVVRDPALHAEVLRDIAIFARDAVGLSLLGATFSPIRGPEGNIEFICMFRPRTRESGEIGIDSLDSLAREAHEEI
jgi:23S rRNA (cytidine1920-2'-O)/16S rRNA (cytidine1409-2'-O)-methyltransferase